jgi:hypothetical protein
MRLICAIALNGRNRRSNLSFSEFSSAMRSAKLRPLNRNVERVFDPSMKDSRDPFSVHEEQTNFLATVLNTNAINFSDDRKYQAWAVSFYLENAKNRLSYAITIADEHLKAKTRATVMPMLRFRGTSEGEKDKGDRALTRYEWECAHGALRILLKILDPTCDLPVEDPKCLVSLIMFTCGEYRGVLHDRHFNAASSFQIGVSRGRRMASSGRLARVSQRLHTTSSRP